jgi:glycosyltransferase involved in cell wall biosynthesis
MIKVVRVVTRLNVGGPARHVALLSRELMQHGFATELIAGVEGPREGRLDPGMPVTTIRSLRQPIHPRHDVAALRDLTRLVRSHGPQIVHTHMAKAGALGRVAAARARVPLVVHTYHGHVLEGYFSRSITKAFLAAERALARRTDILIAVSAAVRDELLGLGIGRPEQWRVVPLGLDLDQLLAGPLDRTTSRRRLGLPEDGPAIGIVGRLVPIKDHETFLEASTRLARAHPDATFVVAGDGPLRASLEYRARRLLGNSVRFLGWCNDLPALYGALDIAVLTSRNEGTPVALIEAAAASRPVVATRVGGVADVVRDAQTGILVAPGDPGAVAEAVSALLKEPDRAVVIGEGAKAWVQERFSARRLVADTASLYEQALADSRSRRPA